MYAIQTNVTVALEVVPFHLLQGKHTEIFGNLDGYSSSSKLWKSQIQYCLTLPWYAVEHYTLAHSSLFSYLTPQILRQS